MIDDNQVHRLFAAVTYMLTALRFISDAGGRRCEHASDAM